ncbi:MAG: protein kinase [Acidobacteria bacterium]|nr:protein kinase [Acidobacteriota bacterium]
MLGTTLAHYEITGLLGKGGMGQVYRARDTRLRRDVALKVLTASFPDEAHIARFQREAETVAGLSHPNIVHLYSVEEANGVRFLTMELVDGQSLDRHITRDGLRLDEVLRIGSAVADALAAAHAKGIVHRDLKPSNVMVTPDGRVKVLDFGLAKTADRLDGAESEVTQPSPLTQVGAAIGTVPYMSPEQLRGMELDHRSDLFSFGILLYELATGQRPFQGPTNADVMSAILKDPAPDLGQQRPGVPRQLAAIVTRCLEKDVRDRPDSAAGLRDALLALRGSGSQPAVVPGAGSSAGVSLAGRPTRLVWMVSAAVLVALAALAVYLSRPAPLPVETTRQTIAVLPFVNISPDPDQEYFSDGLSEELLTVLARNPALRVTSRTSSFSFKGTSTDIKTIASKLRVRHVLQGSVRRSGNALRVTAQLINVETDAHLWSDAYDGTMDDVFAVQDTIAAAVAKALDVVLRTGETPRRTTTPEAYNAFLLGKHAFAQQRDLPRAAEHFERAIAIDARYAPAWVWLSRTRSALANAGDLPLESGYAQARAHVNQALALDPTLADAHAQLGHIRRRYDWDWRGADEAVQRALALDATTSTVLNGASGMARTMGRFDEAVSLLRRAIELDPISASLHFNLGLYATYAGTLDDARAALETCLGLSPQFPGARSSLGLVLLDQGRPEGALVEMLKEADREWQLHGVALVQHALGDRQASDAALAELIERYANDSAYQVAEVHAYRGNVDEAFRWLERSYTQRDGGLASIKGDPLLRSIVGDPRYAALLAKLRLPL